MRLIPHPKIKDARAMEPCECQHERKVQALLRNAQIPKRYEGCTISSFKPPANLLLAFNRAQQFAEKYPAVEEGLLLTGSIGVGKTHLAVAILQRLILRKSVPSLFCDHRTLLKALTHSYDSRGGVTEQEILQPIFDAEVLVLDELGAAKPTEWVWDVVALILNTRYTSKRTTIVTTNFANLPSGMAPVPTIEDLIVPEEIDDAALRKIDPEETARHPVVDRKFKRNPGTLINRDAIQARQTMRRETLGDRIGDTMWSRLQEMCVAVEMKGVDYRNGPNKARFS